ncbi:MAG: DUF4116 domain-containing protein, partial [Bacteroidota bacterium]
TRKIILTALKKDGSLYKEIPLKYRAYYDPFDPIGIIVKDPELLRTAVGSAGEIYTDLIDFVDSSKYNWVENWIYYDYLDLEYPEGSADLNYLLHNDYEIALAAVKNYYPAFKYVPEELMTKELVIAAVERKRINYDIIPETYKNDKDVALAAVKSSIYDFDKLSDSLKLDFDIKSAFYKGVINYKELLLNVNYSIDKEVVEECVQFDYNLMYYADSTLKNDKDYALRLIKNNGNVLKYLHKNLQKDKDIVIRAFLKNSESFQYADISLRKNRQFVLELLSANAKTEEEVLSIKLSSERIKLSDYFVPTNSDFYSSVINEKVRQAILKDSIGIHNSYLSLDKSLKSDIEISKNIVFWNPSYFSLIDKSIGEKLLNDADFIQNYIKKGGEIILIANEAFLKDTALILLAIQSQPTVFKFLNSSLKSDKNFINRCFDINPSILPYLSSEYTLNREFVFRALKKNGLLLEFLDNKFKNDERAIIEALKQNGLALKFVNDRFKNNEALVSIAVKQNGMALEFASDSLRNNEDIALIALLQNKKSYKYIGEVADNSVQIQTERIKNMIIDGEIKNDDSDIAKTCCQLNGNLLEYFSDEIKNDTSVVSLAIENNGSSFRFASNNLRQNKQFILATVKNIELDVLQLLFKNLKEVENGYKCSQSEDEADIEYVFKYMDTKLNSDKDLFLEVIKKYPCALQYANDKLLNNLDFMLRCVDSNGLCIQFANKDLMLTPKLQFAAVKSTGRAISLLDSKFLSDRELVLLASKTYGAVLELCPQFKDDKEIVSEALKNNGRMLEFTGSKMRSKRAIVELAIQSNGLALEFADEKLKKDKEIIKKAILKNPGAFEFANSALRRNKKYVLELLNDCTCNLSGIDSILLVDEEIMKFVNLEITIGDQVWMNRNLNVSTFRNGDLIPEVKTNKGWEKAGNEGKPAWCYFDNDPKNGTKYGKLYNWFAVKDPRGIAPEGWHVPSDSEWTILKDYLLGDDAGKKMKSTSGWREYGNGTNESGFSGLPGGSRYPNGTFDTIGYSGYWWSSTEFNTDIAWGRYLTSNNGNASRDYNNKRNGLSVRCLRD